LVRAPRDSQSPVVLMLSMRTARRFTGLGLRVLRKVESVVPEVGRRPRGGPPNIVPAVAAASVVDMSEAVTSTAVGEPAPAQAALLNRHNTVDVVNSMIECTVLWSRPAAAPAFTQQNRPEHGFSACLIP
jgi:hypothetical protein